LGSGGLSPTSREHVECLWYYVIYGAGRDGG